MPEEVESKKIAIYCVHGMGQQMRFETLDNVVQGIRSVARETTPPQATTFELEGRVRQRLEMKVEKQDANSPNNKESELHLYEAYWAPVTEGQVSLANVMGFLINAGLNGIKQSFRPFKKWMFGKFNEIETHPATFLHIAITLVIVLLLTVLNAGAVLLTYANLFGEQIPKWLPGKFINLTTLRVYPETAIVKRM